MARLEEHANREIEEMAERARSSIEQSKAAEHRLSELGKEKARSEQKLAHLNARVAKLTSELSEERGLNECLRRNQDDWSRKLKEMEERQKREGAKKDGEISELQEQLRDVMFFLQAQEKIAASPMKSELENGEVTVGEAAAASTTTSEAKKGGRKKRGGK